MKREDFRKLLDSVEPIPRMVTIKSLGGVVMRVRPLKVSEEKELAGFLNEISAIRKKYNEAISSNSDADIEEYIEEVKRLNSKVVLQKVAYCLVDEDGRHIVEDISELECFGVDVIEEITAKIDESATYKSLGDAIKKK